MKKPYKAAFVIPAGAKKTLGQFGWEFEGAGYVSDELKTCLLSKLNLQYTESYSGVEVYENSCIKASVVFDDLQNIENIFFEVFEDRMLELRFVFDQCASVSPQEKNGELFVPS